ncbi:hypothetical protein CMEL01_08446 [Colletotrichum melonis]|uniref:Uncharacterized protein n=2 Tax=Colletotrichum acutatum species complex TaxID=2707335 RepID=A0AAI9XIL9_9PEZI|nr:uncharacterized protein CTAM01_09453 [Colletotrichum tamarilloi]KAK1449131.1 hypothetical protein CMEL01_08446 [Colletotrichum melonis]KAK1493309.1 hypothetical protein CTAM01_09453 [Colletotrichum tamarilloi]
MVIGLLAIAAIPTVIGTGQAVSAQKKQNAAAKEQAKFSLTATMTIDGKQEECPCIVVDNKIWISHSLAPAPGHKFSGYYFNYPSEPPMRALVSTIAEDPPMLNWIYVDADSRALRHGGRKDTLGHVIGPWGWTDDERYLSLRGSGLGFVAVLEEDGRWAAYWDPDGRLREGYDPEDCIEIALRRQMALGIESAYVKG